MPRKPQTKPAAEQAPKTKPLTHEWESKGLIHRVHDGLKERLLYALDQFVTEAYPAEAQFLIEVLSDRDASGPNRKEHGDHDVPLLSAMEQLISGFHRRILMLPDPNMAPAVNEFIQGLEKTVEADPEALKHPAYTPSEIRTLREKELRELVDVFAKHGSSDDLYFLVSVLNRWDAYTEYDKNYQPPSPIMAAFQTETDGRSWLIEVPHGDGARVGAIARAIEQKGWLGDLLNWIANKALDLENLSPCLIASKAAGMQEAWNKQQNAAA